MTGRYTTPGSLTRRVTGSIPGALSKLADSASRDLAEEVGRVGVDVRCAGIPEVGFAKW
jgi:hypothetical protein